MYGKTKAGADEIMTEERLLRIKKLRMAGLTCAKIGEIVGLSPSTVQYHLNPVTKRKNIERNTKWNREHSEECNLKNKKWRNNHKIQNKRIVCFSVLKHNLKNNIVKVEEIEEFIEKYKQEQTKDA